MNKLKTAVRWSFSAKVEFILGMEGALWAVAKSCHCRNFGMYCFNVAGADCDVMISVNVSVRLSLSSVVADVEMARTEAASRGTTFVLSVDWRRVDGE